MPTTRRRQHNAATANQSTLSFKNKVTKPTDSLSRKSHSKLNELATSEVIKEISTQTPEPEEVRLEPETPNREEESQVSIRSSPATFKPKRNVKKSTSDGGFSDVEKAAHKVSDVQIKKYWTAEEDARLAPRVHQQTLSIHEKILRHFDLSSQYGPCIGTPRLHRWTRAHTLGLNPPIEVLAVLLKEEAREKEPKKFGPRQCGKLAYIDELAGGRVVLVE